MSLTSFGERIKALRKTQGISQEEFAKLAGINRSYVAGMESGKRNVSLETIEKIASAFGLTLFEFFNYDTVVPQQIIYLNIDGEQFAMKADKPLTLDQKNYLDALTRCFMDDIENDDEYERFMDMSTYDLAGWFVDKAKEELGVNLRFVAISDEYSIHRV